jgi:hypothetical protein
MENISRALELSGPLNTNAIRGAARGNDKTKPLALELLVNGGYIEQHREGQRKVYRSLRVYRADNERTEGDQG